MNRVLGSEPTLPAGQDLPGGGQRYYIGPARPMDLRASQARPTLDTAMESWRHEIDQPDALAVRAERPWFVVADFDWRGPTKTFDRWPRRSIDLFGIPQDADQDLDWLLLQASWYGESSARRPDSSFSRDVGPGLAGGLSGLGILVLAVLFLRR
jgi:hypothetical protein